jgi:transposase
LCSRSHQCPKYDRRTRRNSASRWSSWFESAAHPRSSREFGVTAQSITNWVGQAAIDEGKPLPGKEGVTTAEREELARLRRQLRQVQMERDILAKATAWFAGRSDATSTKSSDS